MGGRRTLSIAVVTAALLLGGCAATSFDGQVYRGQGFAFRVSPAPASWQPVENSERALAWEEPSTGATIIANGRCDRDGEDVPLRSLTQHLFIQFTDRTEHGAEVVELDGREALRTDVTAKLDGVPRRFVVWVMKKDRCVYDLLYFAPEAGFDASGFDAWARGFSALPREVDP